jgi:isoleucyl-tRNA synthetase
VHLEGFADVPAEWRDDALAAKWAQIRAIRAVVTGALEVERAQKRIGSSLEAAPIVYVGVDTYQAALEGLDFAEICITSAIEIRKEDPPEGAFKLQEVPSVGVIVQRAKGKKCARSWKISEEVGADPEYPDVTPRDAQALRELKSAGLL